MGISGVYSVDIALSLALIISGLIVLYLLCRWFIISSVFTCVYPIFGLRSLQKYASLTALRRMCLSMFLVALISCNMRTDSLCRIFSSFMWSPMDLAWWILFTGEGGSGR